MTSRRKVRADTYPSTTDLDLIEAVIPRHMLDEYVEILIDKVDDDRYPSIDLSAPDQANDRMPPGPRARDR